MQQPRPPIMIGAAGEKLALRVVAKHADIWNCPTRGDVEEFRRKSAVLDDHCAAVGRDPLEMRRSVQLLVGATQPAPAAQNLPPVPDPAATRKLVIDFIQAGATHIVLAPIGVPLRWLADEVDQPALGTAPTTVAPLPCDAMAQNKTEPESRPATEFIAGIADAKRRADSQQLLELMRTATGVEPVMWGPSIVGCGTNHYSYESGREGDTFAVGFAPRAQALVLYGLGYGGQNSEPFQSLGTYTTGKGCIYIKRLGDVDLDVLEGMIKTAFSARNNAGLRRPF